MSWLCDNSELILGAWLASKYAGHGVAGYDVPSGGLDGPGYFFHCLELPADGTKEVRAEITRWPAGVFAAEENGVFVYTGATDYVLFRVAADGAVPATDIGYGPGIGRLNLNVGEAASGLSGGVLLDDIAVASLLGGGAPSVVSGGAVLADLAAASQLYGQSQPSDFSGGALLDDIAVASLLGGGAPSVISGGIVLADLAVASAMYGQAPPAAREARWLVDFPRLRRAVDLQ